MMTKLTKNNQSLEKALKIIELMAEEREPMRLQDIAVRVTMPASTVLRMINTLYNYGYVMQDSDSLKYSLTLKFAKISTMIFDHISIRNIARPLLIELTKRCGESSCLAVEQNMEAAYIDVVESPNSMLRLMQRIGKSAPLHCTGVGKLMLLNYDSKQIDKMIAQKGLPVFTPNTIPTKEALLDELEQIRKQGYSYDNEECELGARCIAAPVRDFSNQVIAVISISGLTSQLTFEKLAGIKPLILDTAMKISILIGYSPNEVESL